MQLLDDFALAAKEYIGKVYDNPVYPAKTAIDNLGMLDTPLQQEACGAEEVFALLHNTGSPATVKSTGGRYYGFVTGGSLPAALGAKLLSTVWDQNAGLQVMSPISATLENIAGKWLIDIFGLPVESGFGFVTGDTMANFSALAAARHTVLKKTGWDVEANGLFGAPTVTVVVGNEVHVSVLKALSMLGFGHSRIIRVPADDQGRIIPGKIPKLDGPAIICAQSGNVNSGAFDDVEAVCAKRGNNTWVHVDAAFGLWAAASQGKKHLVKGIELADSWATDGHKWLNVPYDCGIVFVRDKEALFNAMNATAAAYIPTDAAREPFQYVPEMSRQARAVPVWAALKSLGKQGLEAMIDRHCRQAQMFARALTDAGYTILNDVVLNQVLVNFGSAEQTQNVIRRIQEDGVCWCGGTVWQGKAAMRISVSGWATTDEDVRLSVESIVRCAGL